MIGPNPLYIPLRPSSRQMTRAVPNMPRYTTCVAEGGLFTACARNPPCACNFVFITSKGHVIIPEVNPPVAPARALNVESDLPIVNLSNDVSGALSLPRVEGVLVNWCLEGGEEANFSEPGDVGVLRSCDIVICLARVYAQLLWPEQRFLFEGSRSASK
jgi:hypothetical protein